MRPGHSTIYSVFSLKAFSKCWHLTLKAGEGRWGTDELAFSDVLAKRSHKQLRATFQAYQILIGKDIEEAIEEETSGDLQKAYLTLGKIKLGESLA